MKNATTQTDFDSVNKIQVIDTASSKSLGDDDDSVG